MERRSRPHKSFLGPCIGNVVEGLSEMLPKARPVGFNVRGGAEEQVGMKTFELLDPLMIYLVGDPS